MTSHSSVNSKDALAATGAFTTLLAGKARGRHVLEV
jgi:hypothetical protein